MLVNIQIIEKPDFSTKATFALLNLNDDRDFKEAMAILTMVCSEYHLDPEIDPEDLKGFAAQAKEKNLANLEFQVTEDGIELEFVD